MPLCYSVLLVFSLFRGRKYLPSNRVANRGFLYLAVVKICFNCNYFFLFYIRNNHFIEWMELQKVERNPEIQAMEVIKRCSNWHKDKIKY